MSGAPSNELWVFNYVDLEWRRIMDFSGAPAAPRYRHTSEMIGSRLFILGGSDNPEDVADGSSHLDLHEMNLATLTWSHPEIKGINPFPRSGHGSVVIGAKSIAIFGGKRSAEVNSPHLWNDISFVFIIYCLISLYSFTYLLRHPYNLTTCMLTLSSIFCLRMSHAPARLRRFISTTP